jgi:hypothetical protein
MAVGIPTRATATEERSDGIIMVGGGRVVLHGTCKSTMIDSGAEPACLLTSLFHSLSIRHPSLNHA